MRPHGPQTADGGPAHVRAQRRERHRWHRGAQHVPVRVHVSDPRAVQAKRVPGSDQGDVAHSLQSRGGRC